MPRNNPSWKSFWLPACFLIGLLQPLHGENLLLISIDTLRADRLSCYGYRINQTPAIDRWAAEGVRFENAYTEYPLTLPAHSTLFTGTYPLFHGVRENVGFSLAHGQITLAGILKSNGYATAGFIGSYVLSSQFGVAQGFDLYDEEFGIPFEKAGAATALRRSAEQVTGRFLTWLDKHRQQRFFAFVHFYDPHAPCPNGYDREVSNVDLSIGKIDGFLRKSNLLATTHIVLVSDHGESLGEHAESGHGFYLYDSTLRVPLIVRPAAGYRHSQTLIKQPASLADVMPTILQLAGLPVSAHVQGRALGRMMMAKDTSDTGLYAESHIPQLHFGWSPLRSWRLGRYVFIDAPRPELYDIVADPAQKTDIISRNQALAQHYRAQLEEFTSKYQRRQPAPAPAGPVLEAREKLAALGYVQLGKMTVRSSFGTGIDPKDRIHVFESYHEILNEIGSRNISSKVLERIDAIRKQAPELRSLIFLEAQAFEALGRLQDARLKYRQGLDFEPQNNVARAGFANLLLRAGETNDAEREFKSVLAGDPQDYRSRNNLAGIYAMTGRMDSAIAELNKALAIRPTYAAAWQNLGQAYVRLQDWRQAEAAVRRAVSIDKTNAAAHFLLSRILNAAGKKAEADQHLNTALKLDPNLARRIPDKPKPQP